MNPHSLRCLLTLFFLFVADQTAVEAAAVGKGAVAGGGGRGIKGKAAESNPDRGSWPSLFYWPGLRHKPGAIRKPGDRRPVLSSSGIRAGANTVVVDPPGSLAGVGVGGNAPPGSGVRRPEEAEAYYNNPDVRLDVTFVVNSLISCWTNQQGAKVIDASHFESEYILGRKLAFYCMAQGNPRPHITWLKDGIELYAHPFFQVSGAPIRALFDMQIRPLG